MLLASQLHGLINRNNFLQAPSQGVLDHSKDHKTLYKIALIANHIFRAGSMLGFMMILPFSNLLNHTICIIGSLFYRLTVENNCAYKFALPSCAGAMTYMTGKSALLNMISCSAFLSLSAFASATASLLPLAAYLSYVVLAVDYDVDHKCCHSNL